DPPFLEVHEARAVPTDVRDRDRARLEPRLHRRVAEVIHVAAVLGGVGLAGEIDASVGGKRAAHLLPAGDELLVDRVELVVLGKDILQPVPLHDARLEKRGRRVRVVFEHRGLARAVPREVEAPVEARIVVAPRALDERVESLGDPEALVLAALDHAPRGLDAALLQLARGGLQAVDLRGAEAIARALVPVDRAVDGVEIEAERLDLRGPVHPRNALLALHRLAAGGAARSAEAAARRV